MVTKNVEVGMNVQPGQQLATVIPLDGKPLTMTVGPLQPGAKPTLAVIVTGVLDDTPDVETMKLEETVAPAATGKEQRLADLLRRYQADEITPLQYHTERAKIVAEP